jgi:hypothetical protein
MRIDAMVPIPAKRAEEPGNKLSKSTNGRSIVLGSRQIALTLHRRIIIRGQSAKPLRHGCASLPRLSYSAGVHLGR